MNFDYRVNLEGIMKLIIEILAVFLCSLAALGSITLFRRFQWPAAGLWIFKLIVSACTTWIIILGIGSLITALVTGSVLLGVLGLYVIVAFSIHRERVTCPPGSGFEGNQSGVRLPNKYNYSLRTRRVFSLPAVPEPHRVANIPFATIPGRERKLYCDLWQPSKQTASTGLVFIYLHGSAWYLLDKDVGTRPLFRHLAAQGHTVVDVAYRLAPETDMMGMIHDAKRAIHWVKEYAGQFGVRAEQVVIGGGSAGAHLALMAGYTSGDTLFTPPGLGGKNLSVDAVISLYGPADLEAMYYHTNQHLTTRSEPGRKKMNVPEGVPAWVLKAMGKNAHRLGMDKDFKNVGALATLFGGHPDECPDTYRLFSPVTHVDSSCPPTLILHGEHDCMVPVNSSRLLHRLLAEHHVKARLHTIPQADHAFDLPLPRFSPSAHNAIYDIERFLTMQLMNPDKHKIAGRKEDQPDNSPYTLIQKS
jgi:acetyl esterase/lipase